MLCALSFVPTRADFRLTLVLLLLDKNRHKHIIRKLRTELGTEEMQALVLAVL